MRKISCGTLSCDGFENTHFKESFRILPKVPITYVEFDCWHPGDLTQQSINNIMENCEKTGINPIGIYSTNFGGKNQSDLCKDVAHKIRMLEVAKKVNCKRIVATACSGRPDWGLKNSILVLKEIVPMAEEYEINVCLENHYNNTFENIKDYYEIFSKITSDKVGLCVDTGHFDASNINLGKVASEFKDKINHIHLKDCKRSAGKYDFVNFGEGETDNFGFLEKMIEHNYNGYMTLELAFEDKSKVVEQLRIAKKIFKPYEDF